MKVRYPLYFVSKGEQIGYVQVRAENSRAVGFPVFHNAVAAVAFRNKHYPTGQMSVIADEAFFADLLRAIRDEVLVVVFDPNELGVPIETITVGEILQQLP